MAAYLGLIPQINESRIFKGRTSLSRIGPSRSRSKIYLAAVSAFNHNPDIKTQKTSSKGRKNQISEFGVAMRKLV